MRELLDIQLSWTEILQVHEELRHVESRVDAIHKTLRKAITELFGSDRQALSLLAEAALAARIADAVGSRLSELSQGTTSTKHYVREREAAEYMGVSVAALRSWRLHRSKHGPPFTREGRMVIYPKAELENYMRERLVPPRG